MDLQPEPQSPDRIQPRTPPHGGERACMGVRGSFETPPPVDGRLPERQRLRVGPLPLPMAAACLASTLAPGCTVLVNANGSANALDDATLGTLVRRGLMPTVAAIRLADTGLESVDDRDLAAMVRALRSGQDPLEADIRASWSLRVDGDGLLLQSLDPAAAPRLLSEAITRYAEARLEERGLPRLPPPLARQLLEFGRVLVRPVQTQVWAGFLEIGVDLGSDAGERPADLTLLFDRPSASWHLEV